MLCYRIEIGAWGRLVYRWRLCCYTIQCLCRFIAVIVEPIFFQHADELRDAGAHELLEGADKSWWFQIKFLFCVLVSFFFSRELLSMAFSSLNSWQCYWIARQHAAIMLWMMLYFRKVEIKMPSLLLIVVVFYHQSQYHDLLNAANIRLLLKFLLCGDVRGIPRVLWEESPLQTLMYS